MPRFSPWTASDTIPIRSTAPETANQYFVRPMKSTRCQAGIFWALAPMKRRVVEPAEAGEDAEKGTRHGNGRHHRDQRSDDEHEGEALHAAGRDREEDERGDDRDDVRVDDRVEALAVAARDGGAHRFARSHLFLDALEDDDVRVCRDTDREDEAGKAGQRERHPEEEHRAVEEHPVDPETDDRDDAEEAVEEEQEERDREEAADAGDERLVERVLAERRRDVLPLHLHELDGQRAGLEDEREVLRLLNGVEARDLGPAARDPVAQRGVGDVDPGERADLAVEDDREALREVGVAGLPARFARFWPRW